MGEIELLTKKEDTWQSIDKLLNNLSKGKGSVIAVFGETGMGKTFFLNEINNSVNRKSSFTNLMVDCQSPIGSFKVGKLQPMLPFARAIEALMSNQQGTAEKKFAVNVGMTVLASIPLAGDLFYAVKELGRDWRQFKKDKGISDTWKVSQITQDYFDAILSFATKSH
jgi:ABC-type phosphate/phosphonate transport system ATPase subunit